jgi:hypothetical protein
MVWVARLGVAVAGVPLRWAHCRRNFGQALTRAPMTPRRIALAITLTVARMHLLELRLMTTRYMMASYSNNRDACSDLSARRSVVSDVSSLMKRLGHWENFRVPGRKSASTSCEVVARCVVTTVSTLPIVWRAPFRRSRT